MTTSSIVAAVQMCSGDRLRDNLSKSSELLEQAAERGASMAVLPENFSLMPSDDAQRLEAAVPEAVSEIEQWFAAISRNTGMWIVGGTIPIRAEDPTRVRSACLVFDSHGQPVARYDKIHLFDVSLGEGDHYLESESFEPGDCPGLVDTPVGITGLTICYDLRFAEQYRQMIGSGARVFTVPSAFTRPTGADHWEILLRCRAMENLAYVVAPAQWGDHSNGRRTWGHSMIVDPWGHVVAELADGDGVITAEIDHQYQDDLRERLPCLTHRRM